jgi:5-methylcytosine-specific restriction endonuclease McrA
MRIRKFKDGIRELILNDEYCWRCGKMFVAEIYDDRKTHHHSIPRRFKPLRNILVPICQSCHNEINKTEGKCKYALLRLKNIIVKRVKDLELEK